MTMTTLNVIVDSEFEMLIKEFDERIIHLKNQFGIELKSFGNLLRIALNTIQPETFDNLLERVNSNQELERALDNAGGYSIDSIEGNNAKSTLKKIVIHLKTNLLKLNRLLELSKTDQQRKIVVIDTNDTDYLQHKIRHKRILLLSFLQLNLQLKKSELRNEMIIFYSFNGAKDFDFIYNFPVNNTLILYEQEYQLYQKQLQKRKQEIEDEVKSNDRFKISGIPYEPIPDIPIQISQTIDDIVSRIDDFSNYGYNGYKDECDSLLNEIDEKIIFRIKLSGNRVVHIDSNETVFTEKGDLLKVHKLKVGSKIRIYPKDEFAENLYNVAVETEPDVFGKVEEHSKFWKDVIAQLREQYDDETLYQKLKEKGLRVLSTTVDGYFKGYRKFPMFNNDLRAIIRLRFTTKTEEEINEILKPLLKSKTTYNSTMISLGRGLKQELRLFLKEHQIGEILEKRKFNTNTLVKFIEEFMPLLAIVEKEAYDSDEVINQIENLEL